MVYKKVYIHDFIEWLQSFKWVGETKCGVLTYTINNKVGIKIGTRIEIVVGKIAKVKIAEI